MTPQTSKQADIRLERTFDAPADVVFRAITDPARLPRWYAPSDAYTVTVDPWDLRVGGAYGVTMTHTGGNVHRAEGEFREIVTNRRLAKTWSWADQPPMDTLVTFELSPAGTGTRLVLTHTGFPDEELAQKHMEGWTGCVDRIASALDG